MPFSFFVRELLYRVAIAICKLATNKAQANVAVAVAANMPAPNEATTVSQAQAQAQAQARAQAQAQAQETLMLPDSKASRMLCSCAVQIARCAPGSTRLSTDASTYTWQTNWH
jgi:hypothetical protein